MTETDNAELAERIERSHFVLIEGKISGFEQGLGRAEQQAIVAALRRPAPRVSEEQIAQLLKLKLYTVLDVTTQHGDRDIIHGAKVSELSIQYAARAVLALFAGEALGGPAPTLCTFGPPNERKRIWILKFEDVDRNDMHFGNEDEAMSMFEKCALNWTCTLFVTASGRGQPAPASQGVHRRG